MRHRDVLIALLIGALIGGLGCGSAEKAAEMAYQKGLELEARGDAEGAAKEYARAIERGGKAGAHTTVALAHARLGGAAFREGDLAAAVEQFEAGVAAAREAEGPELGNLLNNLGLVKKAMGQTGEAETNYLEAIAVNHRFQNLAGEAAALNNVAAIARDRGEIDRARDLILRALGVARLSEDPVAVGRGLLAIGDFEREYGLPDDAAQAYDQAVEALSGQAALTPEMGQAYLGKGRVLEELGDRAGAQRNFLLALAQYKKVRNPQGEAAAGLALGGLALEGGRHEEARDYLLEALPSVRESGNLEAASDAFVKLAIANRALGDVGGAVSAYREALGARARLGDATGAATIYMNLGSLFEENGDLANAALAFRQAQDAGRSAGDSAAARDAEAALARLKGASRGAPPSP